jgi:hypothetical protein
MPQKQSMASTLGVGACDRAAHDLGGGQALAALGRARGERLVDQFDAGPGDQALGRHVLQVLPGVLQHLQLAFVVGGEADVPALGGQRRPAILGRHQARHAQAGARPQQRDRTVGLGLPAAHLHALPVLQAGKGHRERGEVVDDEQSGQAQFLAHALDGEGPVAVGHLHRVAVDRVGDGDGGVARRGAFQALQIGVDDVGEAGEVGARIHHHVIEVARRILHAETRVGRADVGEQSGLRGGGR